MNKTLRRLKEVLNTRYRREKLSKEDYDKYYGKLSSLSENELKTLASDYNQASKKDKIILLFNYLDKISKKNVDIKTCRVCGQVKPIKDFIYRNREVKICKNCRGATSEKSLKLDKNIYEQVKKMCEYQGISEKKLKKNMFKMLLEGDLDISKVYFYR